MLLDDERYEAIINYGKEAINKLNANELEVSKFRGWLIMRYTKSIRGTCHSFS